MNDHDRPKAPVDVSAPPSDGHQWMQSIKPNYGEIRKRYLKICLGGAIIMLIFQIALYLIFKLQLLPLEFKTSELVHLLKYLIVPATLNFTAVLVAWQVEKRCTWDENIQNAAPIIAMAVICAVTASAHSVYSITMMLMCMPVFMTAVYGRPRLLFVTAGTCALGLVSSMICRMISPYRHGTPDTKFVPEVLGAYAFLVMATAISLVMIRLLNTQKFRFFEAVKEGHQARQEAMIANQAKSDFLANMSHEIRTPLNAVIGMTEMIARDSTQPQVVEYAGDIQQASNLLLSIINDILDISKIESGRMELLESQYELGSLIHDSYNMVVARSKEKGLTMTVTCDPGLPRVLYGDEYHLRQIIVNILSNAVKYTDKGSVEMDVSGEENGDILRMDVRIKDTGTGIRQEDIPRLFQKFNRLDLDHNRKVEGTGLGLSITKQLVELMQGTIEVESTFGAGSAFTVRIPQKIVDRTPIGDIHVTYMDMHGAVEEYHQSFEAPEAKLLVVDDVPVNLQVISRLLRETRIQVVTACSGVECLQKVQEERYDLILMDHMMPVMDGVETLRQMEKLPNSLNRDVPVVMLTANAMLGAREEYLGEGFVDYLAKPVRGAKLEGMILKYLPADKLVRIAPGAQAPAKAPAAVTLEELKQLLPELDTVSGMGYCAEDRDFYLSMLREFAGSDRGGKLEAAFLLEDWDSYRLEAHSTKSAARMVGLKELSDRCRDLESAAREKDVDYIRAHHADVVAHCRRVTEALSRLGEA